MRQIIQCLLLGLALLLVPLPVVRGADPFSATALGDIERNIKAKLAAYSRCDEFPCPDVDCAAWTEVSSALQSLKDLIGMPQRVGIETTWGDYAARQRTLGYWLEQDTVAAKTLYSDVTRQMSDTSARQAYLESWAEWQRLAINLSKAAQIVADFKSFGDFLKNTGRGDTSSTVQNLLAAGEVLNVIGAAMDTGSLLYQAVDSLQRSGKGDPIPETMANSMAYASVFKEVASGSAELPQAHDAYLAAMAIRNQIAALESAPMPAPSAARDARVRELAQLYRDLATSSKQAIDTTRHIAQSGVLAIAKVGTIIADRQQKELRQRIDELKLNRKAEELAMLARGEELVAKEARRLAILSLRSTIDSALAALSACQKTCGQSPTPVPISVPVTSFTFVATDAAGNPVTRESYGKALAWYAPVVAQLAGKIADFRIEDGRVRLTPEPQRVAIGKEITVRVEAPRCLLQRGSVSGDGETRQTRVAEPLLVFGGKQKAGDYTYTYEPVDLPGEATSRYVVSVVVTVGNGGLLGYWSRTSPAMVRSGRGETVEWTGAPQGLVVSESDGGRAAMAFLPPGQVQLQQALESPNLRCARDADHLQCRFEANTGCGGQWYTFDITIDGEDSARFKVSGGELTNSGPNGCVTFPHSFTPLDFALKRDAPKARLEAAFPCPPGYRCE